jgi:broad specificity phosphatase PhoE
MPASRATERAAAVTEAAMSEPGDERQAFHIEPEGQQPVGPGPEKASFDPTVLDFGHYAGRSIAELATEDPDYLRWLERHPSGVRYRSEIQRVLGVVRSSYDWGR